MPDTLASRDQFEQSLALAGTRVRLRYDPALVGECTGRVRDDGDGLMVHVRFPGQQPKFEMAEDLEPAEAELDESSQIRDGRYARAAHLRKRLTAVQLGGQLSELIYSLDMTETDFMPHQFKPLLALLDSPSKGVLIADEVGLGKTIEAGLIWTELRFRTNATRLLVVCPAMLTEKWKQELARRFGTNARIMSAQELLEHLNQAEATPSISAIICSLQGTRPPTGWDNEREPAQSAAAKLARRFDESAGQTLFDLVVIDEAHHLRNSETSSAKLGRILRPIADHFILLSATPVNNRSTDLFNLVSLVDPDQFRFESEFQNILDANLPLVRLANQLKRTNVTMEVVQQGLEMAADHWLFEDSASLKLLRDEMASRQGAEVLSPEERVDINQRLERVNLLGQVIVRSRKREVFLNRVERRVERLPAVMTQAERELYTVVTEAIVDYSLGHAGVEGFLLAMPQKQMSSCMYAAAERWLAGWEGDADDDQGLAYEAFGVEDVATGSPVVSHVRRAVAGRVDLPALRAEDTKFNQLLELITKFHNESPGEKVLVFSYFRGTLDYLHTRLEEHRIPALVVKGGDDKQAKIDEFRDSTRLRVLLSSEVAAEGVDLQFMRLLVNYDLPWNPMKVEQRIGRIDRIGQKADAISIVNLVFADTIDDRILVRLFEKLKLFEDSLGCTEEVLGDSVSMLTKELLSANLTPQQQEDRIENARIAIEQRRRDQAMVEEHEADFIGLGDYVRDRVTHARESQRRITDEDLQIHIHDFLEDHAPGYVMRMDPGDSGTGVIALPTEMVVRLERYREAQRLPRSKLEGGHEIQVVIRNHVNRGPVPSSRELINQYHPLVRMIASSEAGEKSSGFLYAVQLSAAKLGVAIPSGDYAFSSESWVFDGARKEESVRAVFRPLWESQPIVGDAGFDLLNALRAQGTDWVDARGDLPKDGTSLDCLDSARAQLLRQFRAADVAYRAENTDRIRIQRESLKRNLERRINSLREILGRYGADRAKLALMTEGKIRKHQKEHDVALARLDHREAMTARREALVEGFVRIVP